jgi:amino acid adenylation domain-containing protein
LDYENVAEELTADSSPDDLAYILFTSGSTGVPKGVMQTQNNVLQQVRAYSNALQISCDDRLSMLPAYGFDAAVMDIYGALLNGACLYPLDVRDEQYSGALLDQMSAEQITLLHATPTVFRFLMRQKVCRHDLTKIRAVILGGEETLKSDFDLFKRQFAPPTQFINGLGPSESTMALQFVADHATQLSGSVVPVGLPVDGVDVSLIDEAGQPAGISGEIVLESSCLSVGYWNQPELSSDVFTMSSVDVTKRRYRTGDRARYLPDGQLVFLGRRDDQVKIRGHRVELAEIESVLASHPEVERCAVVMHSVAADSYAQPDPRLVAYVITYSELTTDQLRSYIRSVLPDYMLPAAFVVLNDLPLLANGKLNRAELPAPDWSRDSDQEFVPPGTATEKRLASIWSDVLGVDQIGVHDDFFELGGHSLMAAQLVSRITDAMQIGLPLRRLFDSPTIAELAEHVDALQWALQASQQDDTTGC